MSNKFEPGDLVNVIEAPQKIIDLNPWTVEYVNKGRSNGWRYNLLNSVARDVFYADESLLEIAVETEEERTQRLIKSVAMMDSEELQRYAEAGMYHKLVCNRCTDEDLVQVAAILDKQEQ